MVTILGVMGKEIEISREIGESEWNGFPVQGVEKRGFVRISFFFFSGNKMLIIEKRYNNLI